MSTKGFQISAYFYTFFLDFRDRSAQNMAAECVKGKYCLAKRQTEAKAIEGDP
jgi:hypothetical protein